MAVSEGSSNFLKAVNFENEHKDKFYVTTLIKDIISEVGAQNVVQVITDNAPVCKAMGSLVETQHPHILWTPYMTKSSTPLHCMAHSLNLRNTHHYKGENKMWDIEGDVFDSFEGVGVLEGASLSLDESDMKMIIFTNKEEDMKNANANAIN
ncbi:hypothetical protein PVK06_027884 [Gossypium arboreum]|uniref:DUF659 domain-containing protein n=1 Tax=Gossypium arboreum TaxID=29729 RepID=A0ABR0P406_GOSAR|nr:hypothetical protein PVK06_027884 [Gossypium arboreum]